MSEFQTTPPRLTRIPPMQNRPDRVRLLKDVLRIGRFNVGPDESGEPQWFTFTTAILDGLEQRFAEHQQAGIVHPLCWGHRLGGENDVRPERTITDIAHVWHESGVLWFGVYVPEAVATELMGQKRQVSIGLVHGWQSGDGTVWPDWSIDHIAIVSHGVVPAQHDFIQMGKGRPSRELSRRELAEAKIFARTGLRIDLRPFE